MRFLIAITLCFATSLYGWTGTIAAHFEEQCHVVAGEHHDEALADHVDEHHNDADESSHAGEDDDCEPDHCSDHCRICHVSSSGFISLIEHRDQGRSPALKDFSASDLDTPDSIASRPDTPPPKHR